MAAAAPGAAGTRRIAVVGAGIVGTSIALALRRRGADVTLVDRDEPGRGCSYGNSGAVSPASVAPLAMPGVLASVPGMLFDDESPLYLPLRYLPQALPWLLRFVASARPAAVEAAAARLAAIHAGALDAHEAMTRELGVPELFLRRGHLHLYPDARALAKDAGGWRLREAYGYRVERLDRGGIEALEPGVSARYQIGMYLADHATILNPFRYVQAMAKAYADAGGRIVRAGVAALLAQDGRWHLPGTGEPAFDDAVVAAGAWSRTLVAPLGVQLALESQRGYHLQFEGGRDVVSRTVVLADRKVFVTPMEEGLRVGGTVEIGGLQAPPDARRAAVLGRIARETFRGLDDLTTRTWMGHRPCMPDSVPVVGPVAGRPGLWLATGHGHLGLTDSLNTAQRIADALLGAAPHTASRPEMAAA
ncbi:MULTISPECIES: NAD(P)/FAD-dependent oxidoreductase [Ramlibacter]|uniref:FAD-dependent oxidoreductase n=1 Tax=Ramlibacter pinisoli TaxID=2682844 RepID=A0A6N8J173_9BURK|nr:MULTISPECIES: FAD-dependent oxidoreductase [Ramlibacter]MBA2961983.1 FAD-dependent oxidoreductase [Ramlibacter sp. CGMCC 1.13660]MVQ31926.1 FAD-dependent oxidoreductase [Ramlibacter pinisoli]